MSTLELFRLIAAAGAVAALLGLVLPRLAPGPAHRVALLGTLAGSWLMLTASLLPRADADRLVDRPLLAAAGAVALVVVAVVATLVVDRFPVAWLVALAVALPIRLPVHVGSQSANLLIPLYGVIVVGVLAVILRARRGRFVPLTAAPAVTIPLGLFVAFTLASLLWTSDWTEATSKVVFFYLPFTLLYLLVIGWWGLVARPLRALGWTTVGMALVGAGAALVQFATKTIWWNQTLEQGNRYNRFFRVNGIFFDPNMLGRFLALALIVTLAWVAITGDRRRILLGAAALAVLSAGLVVTFSRSSALMLLVGLAIVGGRLFGVRRTIAVGLAAVVLIGGPALATSDRLRDQITSVSGLSKASEGRGRLVKGGIELWKTEPVVGVGVGSFAQRYEETLPDRTRRRTRVVISHTAPVTVLAELGVVGIALLALLAGGTLVALGRGARASAEESLTLVTILALVIGIFTHSVLYSALFEDPSLWVLLAAGATIAAAATGAARDRASQPVPDA